MGDCLKVSSRAKGVIPEKVSELENDLMFITAKDLEGIVIANQVGTYSGSEEEETQVIVDNLNKIIKVRLLKTLEQNLEKFLPVDNGGFKNGSYVLKAVVSGQKPVFSFSKESSIPSISYYYGNSPVGSGGLDAEVLGTLSNGGSTKEDKEYTYSTYKQYQVFAYPLNFGELSKIEHVQTGINVLELFEKVSLDVEGVKYLAYVSNSPSTGEYTYKFIY